MVSVKDKIRQASDRAKESVEVPEWDVTIEVRSMSAKQRARFATLIDSGVAGDRVEGLWTNILTSCCFDPETGEALFDVSDMEWLLEEKSGAVIDRIVAACLEVSGLTPKAVDDAGKSS